MKQINPFTRVNVIVYKELKTSAIYVFAPVAINKFLKGLLRTASPYRGNLSQVLKKHEIQLVRVEGS